ncbi:MAG TPA: ATP synthase F1 subunit delta [Gemmatimonadales bacterium]|nr:ATP synthase F1 subunit delta [Gemmatimonadales bacterium]
MRSVTVARNYAEALFALGEQHGATEHYGELLDAVASVVETTPEVQAMLMSPRVSKREKSRLLAAGLTDAPRPFVLFLQAVVQRGRTPLLHEIATEYLKLVDLQLNRLRAGITVARRPDDALRRSIEESLSRVFGKQVIAAVHEDPAILGGAIVRVGERVYDGSVRRRLTRLRRQLLAR